MAKELDLQEQEQIDALKAFWASNGNLITWTATLVLACFAGWNAWQWYQRSEAQKAGAMYGELEAAAQAGDATRAGNVFGDMKAQVPKTVFAQQGGLLAAKVQADKGQPQAAAASLQWVADNADPQNAAVARLRLAGVLAGEKKYDDALAQLDRITLPSFAALAADRRGDVLLAEGKKDLAKTAYRAAWDGLPATQDYRLLVEAKLTALGSAPPASAASGAASGAAR